jgi:hypothetical protein
MKECLREEVLQSYFDGELHQQRMEQVTSHLASCLTCSDLARQLEQENSVLAAALAPQFESAVPSERLRQRIDAAIASGRIDTAAGNAPAANVRDWLSSVSDLFIFRPRRALAYASLMVIIGFGLIMGMMRWQASRTPVPVTVAKVTPPSNNKPTTPPDSPVMPTVTELASAPNVGGRNNRRSRNNAVAPAPLRGTEVAANHVKLLPGERSYLQTIAQLDSTIKADKTRMKPEVEAEYQRNLAFVDRTLAVARTAAKSNPNDPDATEFMFSAYQSKVDLLNTVAEARVFDK